MPTCIRIINEGPTPVSVVCCNSNSNTEVANEIVWQVLQPMQVSNPTACYVFEGQSFKVVEGDLSQKEHTDGTDSKV